jgi:hypothetical protein
LTSFHHFGLGEPITRALADEKYITPMPIQAQTHGLVTPRRDRNCANRHRQDRGLHVPDPASSFHDQAPARTQDLPRPGALNANDWDH